MKTAIGAKELRAALPKVVEQVRKGARFIVIYRSRPAFRIVPTSPTRSRVRFEGDSLFRAGAVGRSRSDARPTSTTRCSIGREETVGRDGLSPT